MLYEARICAVCQSTIEPGALFCPKCGTRAGETSPPQVERMPTGPSAAPVICKDCGATVSPGSTYCGKCGVRVVPAEPVAPPSVGVDSIAQPLAQQIAESLVPQAAQPLAQPVAQAIIKPAPQPAVQFTAQPQQSTYVPPVINVTVNNAITQQANQTHAAPTPIVVVTHAAPNLLVRAIYFVFIGWWLGLIVAALGWALNLTIIGLPLGLYILNRLPTVITLRPQQQDVQVVGGTVKLGKDQYPFAARAVWFILVGWWLSLFWIIVAYGCVMTILLMPLAFWMFGRIGAVTTLYRS